MLRLAGFFIFKITFQLSGGMGSILMELRMGFVIKRMVSLLLLILLFIRIFSCMGRIMNLFLMLSFPSLFLFQILQLLIFINSN